MNRAKANSLTRKVQVLALLFAGGAVAAGVIPMTARSDQPVATEAPKPVAAPVAAAPVIDVSAPELATAIDTIAPPVKLVEKPADTTKPPEPVAPPPSAWKYLGAIIAGDYKRAVVTVNEQQKLVAVGSKVEEKEVIEIDPAYIKIKDAAGAEEKIDLAARQKTTLQIATPGRNGAPSGSVPMPMQGMERARGKVTQQEMDRRAAMFKQLRDLSPEDRREKLRDAGISEDEMMDAGKGGGGGKGGK